ncbi:hypothetical protein ACIP2X_04595 [Streptomyces sp. NPDC089424]|uniref:hypothetical protein n=1 Tax=Streptomyces sp. NPDC089424 TaxID=3365917 RepID=UPI00380EE49A
MRRARTRRRAAALAVPTAAVLLGGCGIQETDVVEAGSPATVEAFVNRDEDMLLFFRSSAGELFPVVRTVGSSIGFGSEYDDPAAVPVAPEKTVTALLAGPDERDRAAGLGTALPAAEPGGTVTMEASPDGGVTAALPVAVGGLDRTALRQLICTIAYARAADGQVTVRLRGSDTVSKSGTCDLMR